MILNSRLYSVYLKNKESEHFYYSGNLCKISVIEHCMFTLASGAEVNVKKHQKNHGR